MKFPRFCSFKRQVTNWFKKKIKLKKADNEALITRGKSLNVIPFLVNSVLVFTVHSSLAYSTCKTGTVPWK